MEKTLAQQLREALAHNIVQFSYEKKDGTWREAQGTRNVDYINNIKDAAPKGTGREVTGSIAYWDLKSDGWRSCREDSIIAINRIDPIENKE